MRTAQDGRGIIRDAYVGTSTDSEIKERTTDLRSRVAQAVGSTAGRSARFAFTTAAGFVPIVGGAVSAALGLLDEFAVERLIREPGPIAFFVGNYPSIFEGH